MLRLCRLRHSFLILYQCSKTGGRGQPKTTLLKWSAYESCIYFGTPSSSSSISNFYPGAARLHEIVAMYVKRTNFTCPLIVVTSSDAPAIVTALRTGQCFGRCMHSRSSGCAWLTADRGRWVTLQYRPVQKEGWVPWAVFSTNSNACFLRCFLSRTSYSAIRTSWLHCLAG